MVQLQLSHTQNSRVTTAWVNKESVPSAPQVPPAPGVPAVTTSRPQAAGLLSLLLCSLSRVGRSCHLAHLRRTHTCLCWEPRHRVSVPWTCHKSVLSARRRARGALRALPYQRGRGHWDDPGPSSLCVCITFQRPGPGRERLPVTRSWRPRRYDSGTRQKPPPSPDDRPPAPSVPRPTPQ